MIVIPIIFFWIVEALMTALVYLVLESEITTKGIIKGYKLLTYSTFSHEELNIIGKLFYMILKFPIFLIVTIWTPSLLIPLLVLDGFVWFHNKFLVKK